MSSPDPLSIAELPAEDVSVDGEPAVRNGPQGLETPFKGRAYQLEMLEESMRRNVIVAVLFPPSPSPSATDIL